MGRKNHRGQTLLPALAREQSPSHGNQSLFVGRRLPAVVVPAALEQLSIFLSPFRYLRIIALLDLVMLLDANKTLTFELHVHELVRLIHLITLTLCK